MKLAINVQCGVAKSVYRKEKSESIIKICYVMSQGMEVQGKITDAGTLLQGYTGDWRIGIGRCEVECHIPGMMYGQRVSKE